MNGMIAVVEHGNTDTDDDASEYAFLKAHDTANVCDGPFQDMGRDCTVSRDVTSQF